MKKISLSNPRHKIFAMACVLAIVLPFIYRYIKLEFLSVEDVYTLVSTSPPYHARFNSDGSCDVDREAGPVTRFQPGDVIGWTTDYAQNYGVEGHFFSELVAVSDFRHRKVYARREGVIRADENRVSGPRDYCLALPSDIPSGFYEVERHGFLKPPRRATARVDFPSIPLQVGAP